MKFRLPIKRERRLPSTWNILPWRQVNMYECDLFVTTLRRVNGLMSATFTFFAEDGKVELRIVEFENRNMTIGSNTVWLDSTVTIEAGAFIGSFKASLTTDDIVRLRDQLKSALTSLSGIVTFQNSGGGLSLSIKLDSDGKTSITGLAQPKRLRQGILHFKVETEHFALIRTLRELEGTVREFPSKQTRNQEQSSN
jgi:hypothetical protein